MKTSDLNAVNTKTKSRLPATLKWASINLVISVTLICCLQLLNVDPTAPVKYLVYLPFVIFLLLVQSEQKKLQDGYITYGEAFSSGFLYSIFTGVFITIFIYVYITKMNPDVVAKFMAVSKHELEKNRNLPADQVDTTIGMVGSYFSVIVAILVLFSYAGFGAIAGLISAAIVREERPPFDFLTNNTATSPDAGI
jgi:4-hydroxybenzoate polyprenyltransferase